MNVYSTFESIQGESTRAGMPCTFVRLAGCPLNCIYCDTRRACDSDGQNMEDDEVVNRVKGMGWKLVEITGGEPLLQENEVKELAVNLSEMGYEVLIETSGTLSIDRVQDCARIIMDLKAPGSGECKSNRFENLRYMKERRHEIKVVVTNRRDFEWAIDIANTHSLWNRTEILISPATGYVREDEVASWIMEVQRPLRLQVQLHKILWPGGEKEVEFRT